ncbi:hypothetical protein I7I50_00499 [Histoplasma capsulatum G186AR]|uniref:Uncharacterized protein n=1 Tax=Ajellomyces capsulatus TaxID=5037 RepID=A0A8H8CVU7_AJECA|nr:hypothetical protein I7I52_07767 [Histoplasma capsulatum]QSS72601.1 hypothetical protein I7I50_00499 [Histoplasma capsulatum G186AR]
MGSSSVELCDSSSCAPAAGSSFDLDSVASGPGSDATGGWWLPGISSWRNCSGTSRACFSGGLFGEGGSAEGPGGAAESAWSNRSMKFCLTLRPVWGMPRRFSSAFKSVTFQFL